MLNKKQNKNNTAKNNQAKDSSNKLIKKPNINLDKDQVLNQGSGFIKANFAIARYLLLAIFLAIIALSGFIYYLIYSIKDPDVYSFNKVETSELYQLALPKISNDALIKWTSQSISDIYTFNFEQNLDEHFSRISSYFTSDGYTAFMDDLNDSGLRQDAVNKSLIYEANSCDVVNIINQRQVYNDDTSFTVWYIEVPIIISIQSVEGVDTRTYSIKAIVSSGDDVPANKSVGFVGMNMVPASLTTCGFTTI